MSEAFIGEIRAFGFNFAPLDWAFCNGAILPISQNDALFNLIGTTFGGDGQETFALPNLQGRVPLHQGQAPGLPPATFGEVAGTETVTLTVNQLPSHTHPLMGANGARAQTSPANGVLVPGDIYAGPTPAATASPQAVAAAGGSQPHDNIQPSLAINFCIAIFGVFPSQN